MSVMTHAAYYCSGHGYGHATRVAEVCRGLLDVGVEVTIVSQAPTMPFSTVLSESASGAPQEAKKPTAKYRYAEVDVGMVQPKAYDVDRKATFDVLAQFLGSRGEKLSNEVQWIQKNNVDIVLSDACFLACAAAKEANVPSVLISNFTFDSCYSYLAQKNKYHLGATHDDIPIGHDVLEPLVREVTKDYGCANLLIRLPGHIPIPAFDVDVPVPSTLWVNTKEEQFVPQVVDILERSCAEIPKKSVVHAPLLTRPPSRDAHTLHFKYATLKSLHIPQAYWDHKILLVSFGGQFIPPPRENTNFHVDQFMPDDWIALVCGPSKSRMEFRDILPERFFECPSSSYLPDITAISDVLLGKLGYGTCSEAIATHTPMIHVPRPMFIEEFGLKRWMSNEGVLLTIPRDTFEQGQWSAFVQAAYSRGKDHKQKFRQHGFLYEDAAKIITNHVLGLTN